MKIDFLFVQFFSFVKIILKKAGKNFYREWIFRNVDLSIQPSGKNCDTLGQWIRKIHLVAILAGAFIPTEGAGQLLFRR